MNKYNIIPDANQRKPVPEYSKFSCYCTLDKEWILKNGDGWVLYRFKDEEDKNSKAQAIVDSIHNLYRKFCMEYEIDRIEHPEFYLKTYKEANFPHRAIMNGFVPDEYLYKYSPYDNWFGVSRQQPDAFLERGGKTIHFSLQGMLMPIPSDKEDSDEKFKSVLKSGGMKYIGLFDMGTPVYQDWYGQFPTDEVLEDFIKQ